MYRFVHLDDPEDEPLPREFLSDRQNGMEPFRREKAYPELLDGMSTFGSLEAARAQWARISSKAAERGQGVQIGDFIAEVDLVPGHEISIEDLGEPDEHLTIWGDPNRLAESVRRIYPSAIDSE